MPRYQFSGQLESWSSGSGGYSDKERDEGRRVSLSLVGCQVPEHMLDRMADANEGMPVMTITIDVPNVIVGPQAREALEGVAMMQAAMEEDACRQ